LFGIKAKLMNANVLTICVTKAITNTRLHLNLVAMDFGLFVGTLTHAAGRHTKGVVFIQLFA